MFTKFYYYLKHFGVPVSINEWQALMEALDMGLAGSSLTGFYQLCRALLVKTEAHYDRFDLAFASYFGDIETPEGLPDKIWEWLNKELPQIEITDEMRRNHMQIDLDEMKRMLEERLREQTEEHNGGNRWVGTGGTSPFGHSGYHPGGIRVGGDSRNQSAVKVAGMRRFQEFRTDETLGIRQFQIALRKLRQFTTRLDGVKDELDLDGTIDKTSQNAGRLELVWERPRVNGMKVLLLMDAGGSMISYSHLCNQLFTAVNKSNHFKDLKVFYFHNCIYDWLYHDSSCSQSEYTDTEYVLRTY
ncbi:MAG TPA: VWA domain-containing protein, partial [Syntrophomonas sp.]|nr:VWA domain-containing protein [Syntrophomonas sp.]